VNSLTKFIVVFMLTVRVRRLAERLALFHDNARRIYRLT